MKRAVSLTLAAAFVVQTGFLRAAEVGVEPPPGERPAAAHECRAAVPVRIRAEAAADARTACEGAQRALDFLRKAGLQLPREVDIRIVDRLPGDLDGRAVGCYLPGTRRVLLLTYEAFLATRTWFRLPVDRELYRAAASHEVSHATAACNGEPGRLPLASHEYVAYVTLFATLEPRTRERILARFPGRGLANRMQIQLPVNLADPLKFGAESWRHYLRQTDRAAWLREVVKGDVVEQWPTEGP